HNEFDDISDFNVKIEEMKKELMNNASSMLDIEIICNNILVDEYNLRWNNFIIEGYYRKWAKDLSYLNN
ncbi:5206_t:CDS:1, partial [Rhizophagus irregularis]